MTQYKIKKPVRLIELFSGIGTQAMALRDLGVDFEYWKTSDWDVNAVAAYKAIHHGDDNTDYSSDFSKEELVDILHKINVSSDGKSPMTREKIARKGEKWLRNTYNNFRASNNLGSITNIHARDLEINNLDYCVIVTYSFPCQDLSVAGKQKGMSEGSETRSSLLWQIKRILQECVEVDCLSECLIMENVDAIHNKKNKPDFEQWLSFLDSIGYKTVWQDLNAKNYGIPQNRNRCFAISILSNEEYIFPEPIELKLRLKDLLEDYVDEKYYINSEKTDKLVEDLVNRGVLPKERETALLTNQATALDKITDAACTVMARDWKGFGNQPMTGVIENE